MRFLAVTLLCLFQISASGKGKYSPPRPEENAPPAVPGEDPHYSESWYLDRIGAQEAWQITQGSRNTIVAIVDSGIDYNNSDLLPAVKHRTTDCNFDGLDDDKNGYPDDCVGWNFADEMSLPWDDNGHGTFIAGIISAQYHNSIGGAGVCPGCSLMATRFLDGEGYGDTEDAIRGIDYAIDAGASVINMSFAGEGYDQDLRNVLKKALEHDVVLVAAAGNDGSNNDKGDIYPANFKLPNLLTVAASRRDSDLWENSNYGIKKVHVAAPGTTIWGPWSDGKWYKSQGTSFAAPIVAGAAGLVRSANPQLTAEQVVRIMQNTVIESSRLKKKIRSGGVINVAAAIQCAMDPRLSCLENGKDKGKDDDKEELPPHIQRKGSGRMRAI